MVSPRQDAPDNQADNNCPAPNEGQVSTRPGYAPRHNRLSLVKDSFNLIPPAELEQTDLLKRIGTLQAYSQLANTCGAPVIKELTNHQPLEAKESIMSAQIAEMTRQYVSRPIDNTPEELRKVQASYATKKGAQDKSFTQSKPTTAIHVGLEKIDDDKWLYFGQPVVKPRFGSMNSKLDELQKEYDQLAAEVERQCEEGYYYSLINICSRLANKGYKVIIVFCNTKSAGKTRTSLSTGNAAAEHTRHNVVHLPCTGNLSTATGGLFLGLRRDPDAKSAKSVIQHLPEYRYSDDLMLPVTVDGLRVMIEDSESSASSDNDVETEEYVSMMRKIVRWYDIFNLDMGNDKATKWSIPLQAARIAHVHVNVCEINSVESRESMLQTMRDFLSDDQGIPPEVEEKYFAKFGEDRCKTGLDTVTPEKVAHSIVVANKCEPGQQVDFKELVRPIFPNSPIKGAPESPDDGVWRGRGVCLVNNPRYSEVDQNGKLIPFSLKRMGRFNEIGALAILRAALEEAARIQKVDLTKDDQLQSLMKHNAEFRDPEFKRHWIKQLYDKHHAASTDA